jgi:predicted Rossmann fold flavoprotein
VLTKECRRHQVDIRLNTKVKRLLVEENKVRGVEVEKGGKIPADKVILATGGISYPGTGANDSGLKMASQCGHSMTKLRPGLTGMIVKEEIPGKLQGLTLKNCAVWISGKDKPKKKLFDGLGELLFTHYGVSGPLILSASSRIGDRLAKEPLFLHVDLKPGLTEEQLDRRILKDFEAAPNLDIKNALIHLLPKSMIPVMLDLCRIPTDKKVNEISKEERIAFRRCLKDMTLTLEGLRDIAEAIITRGGIKVNEVDPSTMESKVISDLYFAGEMMDLDALTGGFNLQIAWSTGYLAGISASEG